MFSALRRATEAGVSRPLSPRGERAEGPTTFGRRFAEGIVAAGVEHDEADAPRRAATVSRTSSSGRLGLLQPVEGGGIGIDGRSRLSPAISRRGRNSRRAPRGAGRILAEILQGASHPLQVAVRRA